MPQKLESIISKLTDYSKKNVFRFVVATIAILILFVLFPYLIFAFILNHSKSIIIAFIVFGCLSVVELIKKYGKIGYSQNKKINPLFLDKFDLTKERDLEIIFDNKMFNNTFKCLK